MRRLADYYLNKAPTLDEMKKAHRKFIRDYNCQIHFAHRERQDNRHSPQDVLRGVLARTLPTPTLARIFFATEFTRHLDRSGYIRFRRWRFYAEAGLAKQEVSVHIYTSTLKIEYQDTELAFYTMEWAEDNKHIKEVKNPHVIETGTTYLRFVGPTYGFFGLGLALYFASQGAGRLFWPLSAGFLRMLVAIGGGWLALRLTGFSTEPPV